MKKIVIACCCLYFLSGVATAQSLEKRSLKNLQKGKWEKARQFLVKSSGRNELPALTQYVWAQYYFQQGNPEYNIDSASHAISRSLAALATTTPKEREKMSRVAVDSSTVITLRSRVDSAAFVSARTLNTEEGYIRFMRDHPFSQDLPTAEQLRNAVAYLNATQQNTYFAFQQFLEKYPTASEAPAAKSRYERLLFEEKTRDRRLSSFESFLKEYPTTPFRKEIEKDIFELFTLSGEVERFIAYLKLYPESSFSKRATNILFHVLYEADEQLSPGQFLTDSLQKVVQLNEGYLVPFMKRGKFGFMNHEGYEVIPASIDELSPEYTCGNIGEDVLALTDRVIGRNGAVVFNSPVDELEELGAGFLKAKTGDCVRLLHKSGFVVDSCINDAKILDKRYIAVRNNRGWKITSLSGRPLMAGPWDEINLFGNVISMVRKKRHVLVTFNQLANVAQEEEPGPSTVVEDVKLISGQWIWTSSGGNEAVYDQNLQEVIPSGDHKIQVYANSFVIQSSSGYYLQNYSGKKSPLFEKVMVSEPMVVVRKNRGYYLFDVEEQKLVSEEYDSIRFDGPFLKGFTEDSLFIHFQNSVDHYPITSQTKFVVGKDSSSFILMDAGGKKTLFDQDGINLFSTLSINFDGIQHAGGEYFIINKKEKKGLLDMRGKLVLPIEYDAIGNVSNETLSLLKSMRFGLFNIESRKLIKPQYDKNLITYKNNLLIAFKDGFQGFIDWDNKALEKFDFEEVKYWNDSVALVKRNKLWELHDLITRAPLLSEIKELTAVKETADEKVFIFKQNNLFGVYSSQKGRIIPFSFTDLVNIGSAEDPLYFTEKHVSEASVFVVIYYDANGKMLRREVYEEADEYEKIYCRQN